MKLKSKDIKPTRDRIKEEQNDMCAICSLPFTDKDPPCLDHNHKTGAVRGVLHRSCNALEGKIVNSIIRLGIKPESLESILLGLVEYHKLHQVDRTGLRHPSHLTDEEKKLKAKQKRKKTK